MKSSRRKISARWLLGWFVLFSSILWYGFLNMPDSWRIHERLYKPRYMLISKYNNDERISSQVTAHLRASITVVESPDLLIGDSNVEHCDWPASKIWAMGYPKNFPIMLTAIEMNRQQFSKCKRIVILYGTAYSFMGETASLAERMKKLEDAVRANFPKAKVIVVPPDMLVRIVKEGKTSDGVHPNAEGYEEIKRWIEAPVTEGR